MWNAAGSSGAAESSEPLTCPSCCAVSDKIHARREQSWSIPRALAPQRTKRRRRRWPRGQRHLGGGRAGCRWCCWAGKPRSARNPRQQHARGPCETRAFIHCKCARLTNWEAEAALVGLRYSTLSEYNFGFRVSLNPKGKHFIRLKAV